VRAIATGVIAQEQRQLGTTDGVEVVSTRGKYVYYHYTCSACGHVQPQLVGSEIPATPERPFESQFTCPKCQHRQTVRIGAKPE